MGRRSVPLSDQDRWVFNRLARDYGARPPYPDALVDRLVALAGGADARAVDLGAGTGHLAIPLAARGLHVSAVEPAAEMLAVAAERLGHGDAPIAARVRLVHATAEETGLPTAGFDLAVLADAIQWVDPELAGGEARRVVRAGGVVAVVEANFAATPFMAALTGLLARANPRARPRPPGRARQFLSVAAGSGSGDAQRETFRQEALLDDEAVTALVRSLSYAGPALGPAALDLLVADAHRAARSCGGARFARALTLRWAPAASHRA